jgi:hypothetical protein
MYRSDTTQEQCPSRIPSSTKDRTVCQGCTPIQISAEILAEITRISQRTSDQKQSILLGGLVSFCLHRLALNGHEPSCLTALSKVLATSLPARGCAFLSNLASRFLAKDASGDPRKQRHIETSPTLLSILSTSRVPLAKSFYGKVSRSMQ